MLRSFWKRWRWKHWLQYKESTLEEIWSLKKERNQKKRKRRDQMWKIMRMTTASSAWGLCLLLVLYLRSVHFIYACFDASVRLPLPDAEVQFHPSTTYLPNTIPSEATNHNFPFKCHLVAAAMSLRRSLVGWDIVCSQVTAICRASENFVRLLAHSKKLTREIVSLHPCITNMNVSTTILLISNTMTIFPILLWHAENDIHFTRFDRFRPDELVLCSTLFYEAWRRY